jgi:tRNA threonylcarbamoyladenosine biosynthesis protein TsaE
MDRPMPAQPQRSINLLLPGSSATEDLGRALAQTLPNNRNDGAVVYLQGELGAGKTTCVRSFLRAVGVSGLVRSPTYTLLETYTRPELTVVHIDLYRLQSPQEVQELGLRDLMSPGVVLWVEWPERGGSLLPPADVHLAFEYAGEARSAHLTALTPFGADWVCNLGDDSRLAPYVSNLT